MAKKVTPPERANDEPRAEGLPGMGTILGHAPQLTRNWGPFRAFVAVLAIGTLTAVSVRPEAGLISAGIFVVAVFAALLATHRGWLD